MLTKTNLLKYSAHVVSITFSTYSTLPQSGHFYFLNMRSRQCLHVEMKTFEFCVAVVETTLRKVEKQTTCQVDVTYLPLIFCHWIVYFPSINSKLFFVVECKKRLKTTKQRLTLLSDGL